MKTSLPTVLFVFLAVASVTARPVAVWPYDKLFAEAELICIATPIAVRDTEEKTTLPGIQRSGADKVGHPIPAIGVETTFQILSVHKGNPDLKRFVFYHLRETEKEDKPVMNGPGLVTFNPKEKKRYLLFLKREADGRYSSLTGQTDPIGGIKDLGIFP